MARMRRFFALSFTLTLHSVGARLGSWEVHCGPLSLSDCSGFGTRVVPASKRSSMLWAIRSRMCRFQRNTKLGKIANWYANELRRRFNYLGLQPMRWNRASLQRLTS